MSTIDTTCVNAIRVLSADAIQKANSGHPGLPLGAAPIAYELWANHMNHNAKDPKWANRDRFILSAGHGSMLLYSLLHFYGYGLTMDDIKQFRQDGSLTPGHPEYGHTTGVEATVSPLFYAGRRTTDLRRKIPVLTLVAGTCFASCLSSPERHPFLWKRVMWR